MPITDSAFAEVPELKGKIIQPENSRTRLSVADLEKLFKQPGPPHYNRKLFVFMKRKLPPVFFLDTPLHHPAPASCDHA
jgi:hypothetical protein